MKPRNYSLRITEGMRIATGVTATLIRDGRTHSQHFAGNGTDSTRAVADYCDRHGYRVVCLSNPSTIYRDLQGSRAQVKTNGGDSWFYARPPVNDLATPEAFMLGKIHRTDLLA
jgi:hypothetical protein